MEFNWRSPFFTRLSILLVTVIALGYVAFSDFSFTSVFVLLSAAAYQVYLMVQFVDNKPGQVPDFETISFDEMNLSYRTSSKDPVMHEMVKRMNDAVVKVKNSRNQRDSEYQFFRNIVQHVAIGLIAFHKDGSIVIMNTAFKKLLRITKADNISEFSELSPGLVEAFHKLKTGGRELIRLKTGEETIQLSVYAIELTLKGDEIKLVSLQNIQSELEEKEMEAWQNLVRVLTHEIMNSVTPISSLAGLVEQEIHQHKQKGQALQVSEVDDIHISMQTISRRSEGLIRFVKEFRSLTHIPAPKLAPVDVKSLLEEMVTLHRKEVTDKDIRLDVEVSPPELQVMADKGMIEQVLINLIRNAVQSFEDQADKSITLRAFPGEKGKAVIVVRDNGVGIDPDALEKIFIPFYTTKKSGSGIGLSLSKQIMRQHEGNLSVRSELGKGTEFFLRF
jgi:nitrogen fixation/metabolism regulation signal transduction histidine kinase